jgi:uncharacterized membrane protein
MNEEAGGPAGHSRREGDLEALRKIALIGYALYAASLVFGVTALAAIILDYVKRDDARGTWLESHFAWQIRTFWWSLLIGTVGVILLFVLIGWAVLAAGLVWFVYRIVKGWLRLSENRTME